MRQFKASNNPKANIDFVPEEFERLVEKQYDSKLLKDGYAPFCKHLFIENFTETPVYYAKIDSSNEHLLKTTYEARTEKELPVLRRFFQLKDMKPKKAKFLDIILYSKAQIQEECKAMGNTDPNLSIPYEWGIISVKAQDEAEEIGMEPITAMRNALGKEEGGSGVPLDRKKYLDSVAFWKDHAVIL